MGTNGLPAGRQKPPCRFAPEVLMSSSARTSRHARRAAIFTKASHRSGDGFPVFAVANYLTKRFGQEYRGRGFKFSVLSITTKGQLMKTIAYIFRNPLAAGFDRMPSEYRWSNAPDCFTGNGSVSSGNIIGSPYVTAANPTHARRLEYADVGDPSSGYVAPHHFRDIRTIGDLTMVERRNILKVRHQYPADWTFDEYGVASKCEDEVNDSMLRNTGAFLSDADVREKAKALSPYAA